MKARAADEGPSGGGSAASGIGGQTVAEDTVVIEERYNPKLLRAVAKKHNVDSTKSLVAAYNATTHEDERAVLLGWLRKYHERQEVCLAPKAVLEYAELVNVAPRSTSEKDIVKNLIRDLSSCICEGKFPTPNLAAALHRALVHIDPSSFDDAEQLVVVARRLLASLTREPKLTGRTLPEHEATFLALHQTFFLLRQANQKRIDEEEKQELRRAIAEKEEAMRLSCKHYPVSFHFRALRQAAERLKDEDASSSVAQMKRCLICGLCGSVHVFRFLRDLARCDVDPTALADAYERNRVAMADMGVAKRPWFDTLRVLMARRLDASKDETKLESFEASYDAAMCHQRGMKNGEDLKALRYGIIRELGVLAREGLPESVRKAATIKLVDLAKDQAVREGWGGDVDILVALLDVVRELQGIGQCDEDIKNALLALHQSCTGLAQGASAEWLGGSSIEDKTATRCPRTPDAEHDCLCTKIGRDVGYIPLAIVNSKEEELRKRYLRADFATVLPQKHVQVDERAAFCR